MGETKKQTVGSIGWRDLTVENADEVRDFYKSVVGWKTEAVDMGGYSDYVMVDANGEHVGGVCHARGENADIPSQWMLYVVVEDLAKSLAEATECGGEIVAPIRGLMGGKMAVVKDPAGAVIALWEE
ncbi:MAG: VOC family protein [Marinicaulis sp.]|nr:VOC family protein [Marinicaulis sp.]